MPTYFELQNSPVLTTPSALSGPKITSIGYPGDDTAADTAGGQTITLTGQGFETGASVIINTTTVGVVSVVSSTTITFTSPAFATGSYVLYVINADGGTAIAVPGIQYSGTPNWTTAAGSLGSYTETVAISNTVTATGDAPISYSLFSGSLPTGATLNSANGLISGTSPLSASPTTYTFTIRATDAEQQDTNRQFSLTINPDVVTWSSPANGTTYTSVANSAISNVTLSATAASGQNITYTANALPTGLTLTGSNIAGTPTVAANSSTLLTATAATTNATATRTINWVISVASDASWPYVTTLLSASNPASTFVTDASTNNFAVTVNGDTRPNNFGPYTPGYYSNYFDGNGDFLSVATNSAFNMGIGDYTFEAWIYLTTLASINRIFSSSNSGFGSGYFISVNTSGFITVETNSPSYQQLASTNNAVTANTWTYVAVAKQSGTVRVFVNGVQCTTTGSQTNSFDTGGNALQVAGSIYAAAFGYLTGYVSNARIVKGTAVYTSAFTPPTAPLTAIANTSLLTCQSNRFIDNSTNAFTITRNGDTLISGFDPFLPNSSYSAYGSGYFDGTGDYLSIADNAVLDMGASDFTIECWVYPTATPGTSFLFAKRSSSAVYGGVLIGFSNSLAPILYATVDGSSWGVNATSSISLTLNSWNHVAVTRSSNTWRMFINGAVGSTTTLAGTVPDNAAAFTIGAAAADGSNIMTACYISNFRVVKGTAVYTANFTPPTAPLTAVANTSLLTLQNNQPNNNSMFLDNSTNNFVITRNGNTTQGSFTPYAGTWSNYFDGTGDYLTTPSLSTTAGNATVECWINPNTTQAYIGDAFIIGTQDNATGTWAISMGSNNTISAWLDSYASIKITSTSTVTRGQWNHVALVKSSGVVYIYVNGVQQAATYSQAGSFGRNNTTHIGQYSQGGQNFTGYISNIRVVYGTAVYTTAFAPPTAPLTPVTNTSLLTCADNRFVDDSPNNFTITRNGDVSVQKFSPFAPQLQQTPTSYSVYFDGTGDYLNLTGTALGSSNFTIEMWVYFTSLPNAQNGIYSNGTSDNANASTAAVYVTNTGNLGFYNYPTATTTSSTISLNTWAHVAVVRNSGTITLYINGASGATVSNSNNISDTAVQVFRAYGGIANSPIGYASNVRVVVGTAVYTSNFTPSTTPLTAIANTSLLTCQSTTIIDNSTNNFAITVNGNSQPLPQNPFGYTNPASTAYTPGTYGGSAYFDGSGDAVRVTSTSSAFDIAGNFTVECWCYITAISAIGDIFGIEENATGYAAVQVQLNTNRTVVLNMSSSGSAWALASTSTATINLNSWNHVAVVRSGTSVVLYLNGISIITGTVSGSLYSSGSFTIIGGRDSGGNITGFVSDLRLIQGTALYTTPFVPPAAPLTAVPNSVLLVNGTSAAIYDSAMITTYETVGNAISTTVQKKYGNSSMYFDGNGDILSTPASQNFVFSGDFTVEGWVYIDSTMASSRPDNLKTFIFMGWNTGNTPQLYVYGNTTTAGLGLGYYNGTTSWEVAATVAKDQWVHIAYVRTGTALYGFVAGTRYTINASISATIGSSNTMVIAGNPNQASAYYSYLKGYLDDVRITNGVARYTSNFTPPTEPFMQK